MDDDLKKFIDSTKAVIFQTGEAIDMILLTVAIPDEYRAALEPISRAIHVFNASVGNENKILN